MTNNPTRPRVGRRATDHVLHRFRVTIDQAGDAVFWLGRDGRFTYANDRACASLGYSRDELLSLHLSDIDPVHGAAHQATRSAAGELRQRASWRLETCHRRKNGSVFPVVAWGSRIAFDDEEVHVVFARDITERKRAEAERERLEAELRQRQKMEALGRLAGAAAHDFKGFLTVIGGYVDLVVDGLGRAHPLAVDLLEVKQACAHADRLASDLLAFGRRQEHQPVLVDASESLASLEPMLRRLLGPAVVVVSAYGVGIGKIRVDPHQLAQILMNLATNARDAMPDGGRLTLGTTSVIVTPGLVRDDAAVEPGAYVVITVADTGTGMDAATRIRAFEPFFTTKPVGHGTGLGLSTVYGIVKQSGGYVWADSEPGHGTRFEIYFPRVDPGPESADWQAVPTDVVGPDFGWRGSPRPGRLGE
jgi:two-component system, cell cycle sensor histidine kinase and response regulator CckA